MSDPVAMAAGDIAWDPSDPSYQNGAGIGTSCMQLATSNELTTAVAVLLLGDDQCNFGTFSTFQQMYDPSWGHDKSTTYYPASGNHEYETSGPARYDTYFGRAASPQDTKTARPTARATTSTTWAPGTEEGAGRAGCISKVWNC